MDLIERQAAIDALMDDIEPYGLMDEDGNIESGVKDKDVLEMLRNLPSAQPEIIRCKDCRFWQDQKEGIVEVPICARPQNKHDNHPLVMIMGADDFCSRAERRDE